MCDGVVEEKRMIILANDCTLRYMLACNKYIMTLGLKCASRWEICIRGISMEWILLLEENIKLSMCLTIVIKCVTQSVFPVVLFFFDSLVDLRFLLTCTFLGLSKSLNLALIFVSPVQGRRKNKKHVFCLIWYHSETFPSVFYDKLFVFYGNLLTNLTNTNY